MHTSRKLKLALVVVGATMLVARSGSAYNSGTHHSIVSHSWQVMRAGADPQFGNHVAWKNNVAPAPLTQVGTCAFCGTGATQAAWDTFLAKIPTAISKLNGMNPGTGFIPCQEKLSSDNTLKGVQFGLKTTPSLLDSSAPCYDADVKDDKTLGHRLQGGAYDGRWHPGGIFDLTNPNPSLDGNGYQGLLLGWHAKSGDDHLDDTVFETGWVVAGVVAVAVVAALVAAGILGAAFFGGLVAVICAMAILFCLVGILDGDGCGNGIINGFTNLIEAAHAPITALDNNVPELDGIIPRGGDISDSTYTGMWHYINAKPGGSNSYDDREGLYYDDAGPSFAPGQFDVMIQAGLDLGDLHIGYDESKGPQHYEIRGAGDGHADSDHRSFAKWQGPTGAHLQFSPIDNFAFYGWSNFLSTKNAFYLSWPLHAIGDATVPMHVTGTSSYGHRPYEDSLDWSERWNVIRFLACTPELLGSCAQTCFIDPTDPTKTCPEHTTATDNSREQFEQARRVLQHAFRWSTFIAARRAALGKPTDVPVRDIVTQLALETYGLAFNGGNDNTWPWCDDCSMDWLLYKDHNSGMDFYETDSSLASERNLIERAMGATVAFLMATSDALPAPATCSTTTCSGTSACCAGQTCSAGKCCVAAQGTCEHDSDCCPSGGGASVCRNRVCEAAAAPSCQQAGNSCEGGNKGICCADSLGGQQCGTSRNGVAVCCLAAAATCTTSTQCCSGSCSSVNGEPGTCKKLPLQSGCTADNQCEGSAVCQNDGTPVSGGGQGTCCNPTATGNLDCNSDADCCTGRCRAVGADEFKCQCSQPTETCGKDADCCQGTCNQGTCQVIIQVCRPFRGDCQTGTDCCSGACGTDNKCMCKGTNSSCTTNDACCTGNCVGGVCSSCAAPKIDCFGQCCPASSSCDGVDPNTGVVMCTVVK